MSRSRRAAQPPKTTAKKHRQVLPQGLWHMVKGWNWDLLFGRTAHGKHNSVGDSRSSLSFFLPGTYCGILLVRLYFGVD